MTEEDLAEFKAITTAQLIEAGMDETIANHPQVVSMAAHLLRLEDENDQLRSAGRKLARKVSALEDKLLSIDVRDEAEARGSN